MYFFRLCENLILVNWIVQLLWQLSVEFLLMKFHTEYVFLNRSVYSACTIDKWSERVKWEFNVGGRDQIYQMNGFLEQPIELQRGV